MLWIFLLGAFVGAMVGIWLHGLELMIKTRTHDLVNQEWVKRG